MSSALKRISVDEYLNLERQAKTKSEYFDGEIIAMAGGSPNHSLIAANIVRETGNALKSKLGLVFNSDLRVSCQFLDYQVHPSMLSDHRLIFSDVSPPMQRP